jgi:hypothetical protein
MPNICMTSPGNHHGANLINDDISRPTSKSARDSEWIEMAPSCEWRYDKSSQIGIEFVRGHNHTGPSFLDLSPSGRIETNQEYINQPIKTTYFYNPDNQIL